MKSRLEELLAKADQATPPPRPVADVVHRAPAIAGRRRKVRRIATMAVLLAATCGLGYRLPRRTAGTTPRPIEIVKAHPTVPPNDTDTQLRVQIAQLHEEADFHQRLAERLMQVELARPPIARNRRAAPTGEVVTHVDDAAFALVYQADRLRTEADQIAVAEELYRRVAADFPESPSAVVARRRLAERKT